MPPQLLDPRLESLEQRMTKLEKLPERMDALESQIVQLRTELRGELSAVRQDIREGDEETRRYMRVLHEDVIGRISLLHEGRDPAKPKKRRSP